MIGISPSTPAPTRQIALWLLACCALIFAMVVLGGVTRLTRSGLSMVQWDPIMGVIPPLGQAQWEETFAKYRQFPEYQKINQGMSLEQFKSIFWVEYAHRLLGRSIGLVFLLPFLYFLIRRLLPRSLIPKLVTMFVLGGLQGLLGWLMVKSGLVDQPHVSPYRLSAHLAMAVLIYGYILWVALGLLFASADNDVPANRPLRRLGLAVTVAVCIMILSGGFVAGTKAGFAFNTFPLMNGQLIPDGVLAMKPVWLNFFENIATVQLDHRLIAYLLCILIPLYWYRAQHADVSARTRVVAHVLLTTFALQISLGVATLLLVVPVSLAAAHQAGALLVFSTALFMNHELRASVSRSSGVR
jgi:cytochrome c oxidase assembly protein subunit 15